MSIRIDELRNSETALYVDDYDAPYLELSIFGNIVFIAQALTSKEKVNQKFELYHLHLWWIPKEAFEKDL